MDEVRAWQARPLDAVYPILYLDALQVKVKSQGRVANKAIYIAFGVNLQGLKEVLGLWATLAPMRVPRVYHSTALLLPDGRVLSAGGGNGPGGIDHPDAEVYSPPYLFKGPRPTIRSAPTSVGYGERFLIWTSQAASVARVTLVRLSSVTHSYNQNQRFNDLSATIERVSGGVHVRVPASRNECPPGHYMLFILDGAGVPSVARIIQIQ